MTTRTFRRNCKSSACGCLSAPRRLAQQVTGFIQELRETELYKIPGVSETIDWTAALLALNQTELDAQVIDDTLGIMLKYQDDIELVRGEPVRNILERSQNRGPRRGRSGRVARLYLHGWTGFTGYGVTQLG